MSFVIHTVETAPAASKEGLTAIAHAYGMLPNLIASFAASPAALGAFRRLEQSWSETSFSAAEKQLILVAASVENGCKYCTAAHSAMATMAKADPQELGRIRDGAAPQTPRLAALVRFVRAVTRDTAKLDPHELNAFLAAGFTGEQALEVVVGTAFKALTNALHGITQAPLDPAFAAFAWAPPAE